MKELKSLYLLLGFMTRLPLPKLKQFDSNLLGRGMKWFPVVGATIGVINYVVLKCLEMLKFSTLMLAISAVILNVILTGALHLDGLADTFDGIFSYRSKQKMLEIMKDSRVGTNGAIALILYFIIKIALISEISIKYKMDISDLMLVLPIIERVSGVFNCFLEPYARPVGLGKTFVDNTKWKSFVFSYIISIILLFFISRLRIVGFRSIFFIENMVVFFGAYFGKLVTKKIGGITGDTLGAVLELSSVFALFLIYVLYSI